MISTWMHFWKMSNMMAPYLLIRKLKYESESESFEFPELF